MARKPRKKSESPVDKFENQALTKMQVRRLNALKKMLGDELGADTFGKWLKTQAAPGVPSDKMAAKLAEIIGPHFEKKEIKFPRKGFIVRSGRGGVIIERVEAE